VRVASVRLELGALAHVERDALSFCFDAVTRGGRAAGARLDVVVTPGAAWCMRCSERVPLAKRGDACPRCGTYQLQVVAGEDMRVAEIEIA
jgi:hydrogenase nickel incorporation protein HypA/HybF